MKLKYVKYCPRCKSRNVIIVAATLERIYECMKCNYRSPLFPEIATEKKKRK